MKENTFNQIEKQLPLAGIDTNEKSNALQHIEIWFPLTGKEEK